MDGEREGGVTDDTYLGHSCVPSPSSSQVLYPSCPCDTRPCDILRAGIPSQPAAGPVSHPPVALKKAQLLRGFVKLKKNENYGSGALGPVLTRHFLCGKSSQNTPCNSTDILG